MNANTVERVLIPLLAAFVAGFITAQTIDEAQQIATADAVAEARAAVRRAQVRLQQYSRACDPLLSWPVQATPEIVPAAGAAAGARP